MNNQEIEEFLEKEFLKKSPKTTKFPTQVKDYIIRYGKEYNYNLDNNIYPIFQLMKSGIKNLPKCELENCECYKQINVTPYAINRYGVLSKGCSQNHTTIITNLEKYGVESTNQLKATKEKKKQSYMEKFGVDNPMKDIDCVNKAKETRIEKYGVEHMLQHKDFLEKAQNTMIEKFGVHSAMQNPKLFSKQQKKRFKMKEYIWLDNNISLVQGYEPFALKELENKGYKFNDIITSANEMPPIFFYYNGKKHRYYPDIFIPSENKIIEVKSNYTLEVDYEINQLKFKAVKDAGFDFQLRVY